MARRSGYSQTEWEAFAKGEAFADTRRPFKLPLGLAATEQTAFREGFAIRCEDIKNRPIVAEIKKMVSPVPIRRLFLSLAHPD